MKSLLKPDQSVMLGVASGALIMAIYNGAVPGIANVRVSEAQDGDIEGARKMAAWTSAGLLGFLFLLTRDRNAFMIGGMVLAGIDISVKHSNGMNPLTGALSIFSGEGEDAEPIEENEAEIYPINASSDMGY